MIYTMGAISDCMPVNMTFAQLESEPEFTIIHFDNSTSDLKDEKEIEKPEIRILNIDMKNKFEDGIVGKVYTGEPLFKPDVHVKMSSETFDRISNQELSGFHAFVSGQLKMKGNLNTLKRFDKMVILNPKYKI